MGKNYLNARSYANLACHPRTLRGTSDPMLRILPLVLVLTACTSLPDLDSDIPQSVLDGDFPALVPLTSLDLAPGLDADTRTELTEGLQGRVAALKARAARLRGPVIDRPTLQRMDRGVKLPTSG